MWIFDRYVVQPFAPSVCVCLAAMWLHTDKRSKTSSSTWQVWCFILSGETFTLCSVSGSTSANLFSKLIKNILFDLLEILIATFSIFNKKIFFERDERGMKTVIVSAVLNYPFGKFTKETFSPLYYLAIRHFVVKSCSELLFQLLDQHNCWDRDITTASLMGQEVSSWSRWSKPLSPDNVTNHPSLLRKTFLVMSPCSHFFNLVSATFLVLIEIKTKPMEISRNKPNHL